MSLLSIIKTVEKFTVDNSPGILTGFGVAGVAATAYLTGKAVLKADQIIKREEADQLESTYETLSNKEKFKLVWPVFVVPATSLGLTVTAIILANRIGTRRAAAMAAAFSLSETAFEEYRDKIAEKFGAGKERETRDEVAQDRVNRTAPEDRQIIITGSGEVLCHDAWSGRYFLSTMETIKKAQNDTNYEVLNHGYASLSDFYSRLELSPTGMSEEVGWTSDKQLELIFSSVLTEDDKPCISFTFAVEPIRNYWKTNF